MFETKGHRRRCRATIDRVKLSARCRRPYAGPGLGRYNASCVWAGQFVDVAGNGADVTYSLPNPDDYDRNCGGGAADGLSPLAR